MIDSTPALNLKPVPHSSVFSEIGYVRVASCAKAYFPPGTGFVLLKFKSTGDTWAYIVPTYQANFMLAPNASIGKLYNKWIKGKAEGVKIQ